MRPALGIDVDACARQAAAFAADRLREWAPAVGAAAPPRPDPDPAITPVGALVAALAGWLLLDGAPTEEDVARAEAAHLALWAFPWPTPQFAACINLRPLGDLHDVAFAKLQLVSGGWGDDVQVSAVARLGGAAPNELHEWVASRRSPRDDEFIGLRGMPRVWALRWLIERRVAWAAAVRT